MKNSRFEKDKKNRRKYIKDVRNLFGLTKEIDDTTVKYFKTEKKKMNQLNILIMINDKGD